MSRADDGLAAVLRPAWNEARERWPGVDYPFEHYTTLVRARLDGGARELAPPARLAGMNLGDLYLAGACLREDGRALAALDAQVFSRLFEWRGLRELPPEVLEDVFQDVRMLLVRGTDRHPPRLAQYKGRCALVFYVYVIAHHLARRRQGARARRPVQALDFEWMDRVLSTESDPEHKLTRLSCLRAFKQAASEVVHALDRDERYLLRQHYLFKLTTTQMAPLHRVSQPTISRRLQELRRRIFSQTRQRLTALLGVDARDFESLLGSLRSQLDVSFERLLRSTHGASSTSDPGESRP